jgi:hypothetical protein
MGERKLFTPNSLRSKVWTSFGFEVDGNSEVVNKKVIWCKVWDSIVVYSSSFSFSLDYAFKQREISGSYGGEYEDSHLDINNIPHTVMKYHVFI